MLLKRIPRGSRPLRNMIRWHRIVSCWGGWSALMILPTSSDVVSLEYELILCMHSSLLILMQLCQREVSCSNTASSCVMDWWWYICWLVCRSCSIQHLLHKVSRRELEWVSFFVSDSHRHKLVLLDLDIEHLLSGDSVCQKDLSVSLSPTSCISMHGCSCCSWDDI